VLAWLVICLQLGADLHMAQLMPLPLTVSCFSKIQIGFTFLVLAQLGSPGKRAVKCVCVCVVWYGGTCIVTTSYKTRKSAIADGPRDALCQLKSCQLPRNSAETTYTTSPDQIDGTKLEI